MITCSELSIEVNWTDSSKCQEKQIVVNVTIVFDKL